MNNPGPGTSNVAGTEDAVAETRFQGAVFIGGAGHSGSTLLGMLLGSHPSVFYAGEAAKTRYLGNPKAPARKRVCKLCGPDCRVWGDFVPAAAPHLYAQLAERTGKPIVVDSSKNLSWLAEQTAAVGEHAALVFLLRDGRAVVNSRLRKYPERDPRILIDEWATKIADTEAFYDAFEGPKAKVRYEELATDTERVVRDLCVVLGLDYTPSMLSFAAHEHHVLGGNNGTQYQVARAQDLDDPFVKLTERTAYYADHPRGIHLDLRWEREMPPEVLRLFEELASARNAALAWEPQ